VNDYSTLTLERRGSVGWLLFDRPGRRNAMNLDMRRELPSAWTELDHDPEVRVIVCSGAGRDFTTGLDVAELVDPAAAAAFRSDIDDPAAARYTALQNSVRKPVIAAINGLCVGGGFMWIAEADFAIAASDAAFVDPHTTIGQVVGRGNWALVNHLPFDTAMRLALVGSGTRLSAGEAFARGLITEVVDPPDQLHDRAQALAEIVARNSPAALAATKRAMWRTLQMGLDDACRAATGDIVEMWNHPDQAEGPLAFAHGRQANWQPLHPNH
jgi:enoyl-CoA hydratase